MKGKRYTTEDKIRILREADGSKSILRGGWTNPRRQTKPNKEPLGLTLPVDRKGESGQMPKLSLILDHFSCVRSNAPN